MIAGRARPIPVLLSAAAVWYLIDTTPYHNTEHFYSDAPGLSILQWLNRKPFYFTTTDAHRLLLGILFGSVALMVVRELARGRGSMQRLALPVGALLAVAIIGWNLTGEIAAGNASNSFSDSMRGVLPTPPDWIDRATGRARTMYIGQSLGGSNAFWSVEFWNQSISDVWSVDGSAPGPRPDDNAQLRRPDRCRRPAAADRLDRRDDRESTPPASCGRRSAACASSTCIVPIRLRMQRAASAPTLRGCPRRRGTTTSPRPDGSPVTRQSASHGRLRAADIHRPT